MAAAIEGGTATFKTGALYGDHCSSHRASATRSFQTGMVDSICRKLQAMKRQRDTANRSASGRDLVPVKASIIDTEMSKLGMTFTSQAARSRQVLSDAYQAGRAAGETFEYRPAVGRQD
jgi:hypothetical protein